MFNQQNGISLKRIVKGDSWNVAQAQYESCFQDEVLSKWKYF